jgi:hypothetical protein
MAMAAGPDDFLIAIALVERSYAGDGAPSPSDLIAEADGEVLRRVCLAMITLVRLGIGEVAADHGITRADGTTGPHAAVQAWLDGVRATVSTDGFSA